MLEANFEKIMPARFKTKGQNLTIAVLFSNIKAAEDKRAFVTSWKKLHRKSVNKI